jgi:hypothetical protein
MGAFFSVLENVAVALFSFRCEKHVHKKAEAFCITHKELLCMSCIVQNVHNGTDCNILEIQFVDQYPLICSFAKSHLRQNSVIQFDESTECEMQTEIEDAYSDALEYLEEYKAASYEVTRSEVTKLITRKKDLIAQQSHKLDAAIGYFLSDNLIEGKKIIREIMNGYYSSEITFQRNIPFPDTEEKSLVHVKEFINQKNVDDWSEFCRSMSNAQNFQSGIESTVDSDADDSEDSDDVVYDIAQLYEDESEPA